MKYMGKMRDMTQDYFDAEQLNAYELFQDCSGGVMGKTSLDSHAIARGYEQGIESGNANMLIKKQQFDAGNSLEKNSVEGYANFKVDNGPGQSFIREGDLPVGFAQVGDEII